jgi:hypothetical protein
MQSHSEHAGPRRTFSRVSWLSPRLKHVALLLFAVPPSAAEAGAPSLGRVTPVPGESIGSPTLTASLTPERNTPAPRAIHLVRVAPHSSG